MITVTIWSFSTYYMYRFSVRTISIIFVLKFFPALWDKKAHTFRKTRLEATRLTRASGRIADGWSH